MNPSKELKTVIDKFAIDQAYVNRAELITDYAYDSCDLKKNNFVKLSESESECVQSRSDRLWQLFKNADSENPWAEES